MVKSLIKENFIFVLIIIVLCLLFSFFDFQILESIDNYVFELFRNNFSVELKNLFNFMSNLFAVYLPIIILIILLIYFKNKNIFKFQLFSLIFSFIMVIVLKGIIQRNRPILDYSVFWDQYSFPSGHVFISFVFYMFLVYVLFNNKKEFKKRIFYYFVASVIVLFVAVTRIYLNVHFFTDTLGSLLFGSLFLIILIRFSKMFKLRE